MGVRDFEALEQRTRLKKSNFGFFKMRDEAARHFSSQVRRPSFGQVERSLIEG